MAPQTLTVGPGRRAARKPMFDVHPQTGASIEVFYADRTIETFGRCGAGWFWWLPAAPGFAPDSPSHRPVRYELRRLSPCDERSYLFAFATRGSPKTDPQR